MEPVYRSGGVTQEFERKIFKDKSPVDKRISEVMEDFSGITFTFGDNKSFSAKQIRAAMRLEHIEGLDQYDESSPLKEEELYKFREDEEKLLVAMFNERSLSDEVELLSLLTFHLFLHSGEMCKKDPGSWSSWQKSLLDHTVSIYQSFSLVDSEIQHAYYTRGVQEQAGFKLPSNKELALRLKDLRLQGEGIVAKASLSKSFKTPIRKSKVFTKINKISADRDQEKWTTLSVGLNLIIRLLLDRRAQLILSGAMIRELPGQFKDSHLLNKKDVKERIRELIRYICFIIEFHKSNFKRHGIEIPLQQLVKSINSLVKGPITQFGLQKFRRASIESIMSCQQSIGELSEALLCFQQEILLDEEMLKIPKEKRMSKEEYIRFLDQRICAGKIILCFLLEVNRLFNSIADVASPDTYLSNQRITLRLNFNLAGIFALNLDGHFALCNDFSGKLNLPKDSATKLLRLKEDMELLSLDLLDICHQKFSGLQLQKDGQKFFELYQLVKAGGKNEKTDEQLGKIIVIFKEIQGFIKAMDPASYDFGSLEKQFTERFYQLFRNLPISFVIEHKAKLLQFSKDAMLLSLKNVFAVLQLKDDLQQFFGESERGHALDDLLPDSLIDCIGMEGLEERLNQWIEAEAPQAECVAAPVHSEPLASGALAEVPALALPERAIAAPVASPLAVSLERPSESPPEIFISLPPPSEIGPQKQLQLKKPPVAVSVPISKEAGLFDDLRKQRGMKRRKLVAEIVTRLREFGLELSDAPGKRRSTGSHAKMHLGSGSVIIPRKDQFPRKTFESILDEVVSLKQEQERLRKLASASFSSAKMPIRRVKQ